MPESLLVSLRAHLAHLAQSDGAGLLVAMFLVVLLAGLSPRHRWKRISGSLILLLFHLLCMGLAELLEAESPAVAPIRLAGLFLLLSSIGRTIFLLVTQSSISHSLVGTLPKIFLDIIHFFIFLTALLLTLRASGVEPTSLLTGSAVLTAVLGLSLRDTLGNLFAGVAIQAQRPFEVGDWIQFDQQPAHIGQVIEINWRATKVVTLDAVEIIIPNATLGMGHIVNFTRPRKFSRRSVYVHAPYSVPPQKVQQLILEAMVGSFGVLTDPPPSVVTNAFDERGVQYWVRFFTVDFDKRDRVDGGVRDRIWYALARNDIQIPGPQREVRLEEVNDEAHHREAMRQIERRKKALSCVDFFTPLFDEVQLRLAELSKIRQYAEGETIITQGSEGEELFIILEGEVAVLLERDGVPPVEVARLNRRSFFGEMSLLTGEPRTATVRASRSCEVLVVDKRAFGQILEHDPDLVERISEVIANRSASLSSKRDAASSNLPRESEERGTNALLKRIREFFHL